MGNEIGRDPSGARLGRGVSRRLKGTASRGAILGAGALLLAACGSSSPSGGGSTTTTGSAKPQKGGVIKFAEGPATPPNYIFPVEPTANTTLYNDSQFINLMWPLMYQPLPNQPGNDYAHSIGNAPVYSNGNKSVTITLKHYVWSDGKPVTARDVQFFVNLARAAGPTWGQYVPGNFPANVASVKVNSTYSLTLNLTLAVNPTWFSDNQLGLITPIPQHAWDKTSATGPVGNYDLTPSGAKAVLAFLDAQAAQTTTYATNPLWKVVDGAWSLQSYGGASSPDVFVPNPKFSGQKAYASKFEEIPFTSDSAEFNVLHSGPSALTYGYVPAQDIPARSQVTAAGFAVTPVPVWAVDYIIPNMANPTYGALFHQLYIRQALQHLTDQTTMIHVYMHGLGTPTYGPTPVYPKGNPFVLQSEASNPYPYSVKAATKLLSEHGWKVTPGGTDVCTKGGAAGCGAGVATGTKLSLSLLVSSGNSVLQQDSDLLKSDAAKAGIQLAVRYQPFNTVVGVVAPCTPSTPTAPTCTWQLGEYGGISYSTEPTGGALFTPGGSLNAGTYSNPTVTALVHQVHTASNLQPYYRYESILAKQLPWIWQPIPDQVVATAKNLHGYGLTSEFTYSYGYIEPQYWYFSK